MLFLKRNVYQYQLLQCGISKEPIIPGDYYYEDDTDGLIVKATVYRRLLDEKKRDEFDYSKLEQAQSEREYKQLLDQATRELNMQTLFDRKVAGKEE
jgi:hypothetical protein